MKKQLITLAFVFFSVSLFSNPIVLPPVISEIYWDENSWTMELVFDDLYCPWVSLDELTLVFNEDTSAFITGIPIVFNQPMVVTKNELVEPFEILIGGGIIEILETENLFPIGDILIYGNHEWSYITPVSFGQSIVHQVFDVNGGYNTDIWLVKDTLPSIGYLPFTCQTRANFSGKVIDNLLRPFPDASIKYISGTTYAYSPSIPEIITDENGEFSTDQMFCKQYWIKIYVDGQEELFTTLNIEPDSANYFEFILDSLYVGTNDDVPVKQNVSLNAWPNPFSEKLDINIQVANSKLVNQAEIKLFDLSGNMLKSSKINSPYLVDLDIHWTAMSEITMSSGVYLLVLEADGKILASQKVVYQK